MIYKHIPLFSKLSGEHHATRTVNPNVLPVQRPVAMTMIVAHLGVVISQAHMGLVHACDGV